MSLTDMRKAWAMSVKTTDSAPEAVMSVSGSNDTVSPDQTMVDMSMLSNETTLVGSPACSNTQKQSGNELTCMVCNVSPTDKVHLDAHLNSKAHQNAVNQLRVASDNNASSRQKLESFIAWCEYHHIELPSLVLDMSKQNRNVRGRRDGYLNSAHYVTEQARRFTAADPYRGMYYDGLPSMSEAFNPHRVPQYLQGPTYFPQIQPHLASIPPDQPIESIERDEEEVKDGGSDNGIEYRPYGRQHVPHRASSKKFTIHGKYSATIVKVKRGFNTFAGVKDREPPQLKGLCLPGIGIWDSATPSQRRYRNQRKGNEAVKRIEQLASMVKTTEEVWNLAMQKERERHIYDIPSSPNSPVLAQPMARPPPCVMEPAAFLLSAIDARTNAKEPGSNLTLDGHSAQDEYRPEDPILNKQMPMTKTGEAECHQPSIMTSKEQESSIPYSSHQGLNMFNSNSVLPPLHPSPASLAYHTIDQNMINNLSLPSVLYQVPGNSMQDSSKEKEPEPKISYHEMLPSFLYNLASLKNDESSR
ncbi:hypothetical protein HOO65_080463 [Ceratocystis lukuohia]|uniref:C2H2-type domain-containing protein n=1 Tax=Ceratocystis lukuohia TaxID=2019550 RepID=A0ABR4MBA8_9PEZI